MRLAQLINRQPDSSCSYFAPPRLNWVRQPKARTVLQRLSAFVANRPHRVIGDVSHAYLPHLREALAGESEVAVRVVGLRRDERKAVAGILRWTDATSASPTDHWRANPESPWSYHPIWSATFPNIKNSQDRESAVLQYVRDYEDQLIGLAEEFPETVRIFDAETSLGTTEGERSLLSFCDIDKPLQHVTQRFFGASMADIDPVPPPVPNRTRRPLISDRDPRRCVILVPSNGSIVPQCEEALRALEQRGYDVWRVGGYAAIDQARNQMATDALLRGFEEMMWVDSDISFNPEDLERLRAHDLPIVCGLYPMKGRRALASHVSPGVQSLPFGKAGGLHEIRYAATGFLLVRRCVYHSVQSKLNLPVCNEQFERPTIPFFQPMVFPAEEGDWYLAEDYAFCERVRQCGFKIMADTTIRLWHHGSYGYGWEDAGIERPRFEAFDLDLRAAKRSEQRNAGHID